MHLARGHAIQPTGSGLDLDGLPLALAFSTVKVSGTWSPSLICPVRPISIT